MVKQQRQRAEKGTVRVSERGDRLQLRWTYLGREYYLSVGRNSPINAFNAQKLAADIGKDIENEVFDKTLQRYKKQPEPEPVKPLSTLELFDLYIESRRTAGTSEQAINTRYRSMRSNLKRFGRSIETEADALKFVSELRSRQSPRIANQNLTMLKSFAKWAVRRHGVLSNPFDDINPLKASNAINPKRKPFTTAEIKRLLETAKTHPTLYKWHDFIKTLLCLGLRPSEAIGLRWQDVDLERGRITIAESLSRDGQGRSSGSARVRKMTKTGTVRTIPLQPSLLTMLKGRAATTVAQPSDLIFLSPRGKPIDDHSFSQRQWEQLCTAASVPPRVPYACRHTLLTHLLESGSSSRQAADVAGHANSRMITETYSHTLNPPILPDW
jgi:integrase